MKKYDNYKDSGIEWIGEIPEHWEIKPLKYLVQCNNEALTEKTNPEMEINYIEIGDVNAVDGIKETSVYSFEKAPSRARRIVREGDVIISTVRTYLKSIASISSNFDGFIASTGFAVLTPKLIHSGFLGNIALCEGLIGEIISLSKGVSYPSITSQDLTNISIPLPTTNEQTQIANYLDRKTTQINTLISKKEQFITLLQEERITVINQAVTKGLDPKVKMKNSGIEWLGEIPEHWELWKISHAFDKIGSGTTPESGNPIYHENGSINWLNTGDLNDRILNSCKKKVTEKALNDYSSLKLFPVGSLVIAMYGATIGKTCIINFETTTNQACCVLCKNDIIDINFLQYWFIGKKEHIINLAIGGGQPNISQNILKDVRVNCPNIAEQKKIVDYIHNKTNEIDKIIFKVNEEIELLKEYKTALISEVVTGKVDVRELVLN